ncbi:PilZ domain-containing protein [bacterium]|nr:PilZ domain-containing protein [bacterium]
MSHERREFTRLRCAVDIRYARGHQRIYSGQALDISERGARLVLDEAASSPTHLTLELEGKITLLARTVWAERMPDGSRQVGVCFEGLHFGQQVALSQYLSDLITRAA